MTSLIYFRCCRDKLFMCVCVRVINTHPPKKLTVLQQSDSLQQQSRTLQTLAEAKTRAEERLRVATSDLQGREQSLAREVATLTHSLDQLSEREREVRPGPAFTRENIYSI